MPEENVAYGDTCAACGKNMRDPVTKTALYGMTISMRWLCNDPVSCDAGFREEQFGVYSELFGPDRDLTLSICFECLLRAIGIPEPKAQEATCEKRS
jgi:hypothetical protein